jgi:predicted nucleotidyltransferase
MIDGNNPGGAAGPSTGRGIGLILEKVKEFLAGRREVMFAYIHGSILRGAAFRDIDIAVFLLEPPETPVKTEASLSQDLWKFAGNPALEFDVKVLNTAPLHFQYAVIREGSVIHSIDEKLRVEYEASTASDYLDYKPVIDFFNRQLLEDIK